MPSVSSQVPWLTTRLDRAPARARGGQRGEIDVGGEILLARVVERVGKGVAANRLKRVAVLAAGIAIIDDDRGAAMAREMVARARPRPRRAPARSRGSRRRR